MIIRTDDFETASAGYGVLKHSNLTQNFWFDSTVDIINSLNYIQRPANTKFYNLMHVKDRRYNAICWNEIVNEAKKHMETITPDPTVDFAVNQKVKCYFQKKFPNNSFIACNDLPLFRTETPRTDFIVVESADTLEECKEALKAWELDALSFYILPEVSIENIALAQSSYCKAIVGSASSWLATVSTAGYTQIADLKNCKPFFYTDLHAPFQQIPLSISVKYPIEYITFRYQMYQNMVKYNFDHIKYLRDKYGSKEEKGI